MFLGETLLPLAVFPSRQGGHGVLEVWEDEFVTRVGLARCEDGPSYMSFGLLCMRLSGTEWRQRTAFVRAVAAQRRRNRMDSARKEA